MHSSNEMFGADRILLEVVESLKDVPSLVPEVWLPADVLPGEVSLAEVLGERGVRVRVISLPILRRREISLVRLPRLFARTVSLWFRLLRARPAIVYCATSAALLAAPAARAAGVRSIILHNQEIWSGRESAALAVLASFCTEAIAISESSRRSLSGPILQRSRTIPNAVPDVSTPPRALIDDRRRPLEFLVASRWNSWKGHGTLLKAWDSVEPPVGRLTIVGSPPDVGIAVDVAGMVAALRHPESARIVGQVASITPWVDQADFIIVPSDDPEPFGLVAIEAFSRLRPVIGSDAGGLAEVVTTGVDGILFTPRDVESLASALRSCTRELAARLGAAGRATYESYYSVGRYHEQFAELWRSIPGIRTSASSSATGRARLYQTLRSAHLERAHSLGPAMIIYKSRRYDFDDALARGLELVEAGNVRAALRIARSKVRILEVNEPLMLTGVRRTAATLAVLGVLSIFERRTRVVTYAIENADPFGAPARSVRARIRGRLDRMLVSFVARRIDRIVFGTEASEELYARRLRRDLARAKSRLIPALPTACECVDPGEREPGRVLFLGALTERKGFPLVAEAWPLVVRSSPTARLTVIGTGELEELAHDLAHRHESVDLVIDPPRSEIHDALRRTAVLVLPSQRRPGWREQVGLPIVEALAHGCVVVTTDETGLATWLREHGHRVVPRGADANGLAREITLAIESERSIATVLEDLPDVDGRLSADEWLFAADDGGAR